MKNLLPIGTRVKHKKYPHLTGKIVGYEYNEKGISPLPYKVYWDQDVRDTLGWFSIYPPSDTIEKIE